MLDDKTLEKLPEQDSELQGGTGEKSAQGGLTQEQVDRMIQSALDKNSQKLKTEYERQLGEQAEKLKALEREKMSEEERYKAEREELEAQKREIASRQQAIMAREACVSVGLPPDRFAKRIAGTTQEELDRDAQDLMDFITAKAHELAQAEVNKKLTVSTPKTGTPSLKGKLTEEEIEALPTREERQRARKEHGYIV